MRLELTQALRRNAAHRPGERASVDGARSQTWAELQDRVGRFAALLQAVNVGPGDRVAILAMNSDRFYECMLGVWWAGAALNPVNTRWSPKEVAYSLDDCGTRVLLVDDAFSGWRDELLQLSGSLETVIYIGVDACPPGMEGADALMAGLQPAPDQRAGGDDLAGVFYTGGTTGFPKGVMLSHTALVFNSMANLLERPLDLDVVLAVAPMFHQGGMCIVVRALLQGCPTVFLAAFEEEALFRAVEAERVTFTLLVPTMIQRLLDHARRGDYDLASLRSVKYGASPISEALLLRVLADWPGLELTQGYGMTETGGPITILTPQDHREALAGDKVRLRSAGRPMLGVDLKIVGPQGGGLPPGEVGEVAARGPLVMSGYWNRPMETEAAIRDGWMFTGDVGYLDDRGYLFLVDRSKDMIVSGGENVYSAEVENAISRHDAVEICAVIGVPSDVWGEAVHAVVVLRPGRSLSAAELREHCKGLIAGYKCPKSVEFSAGLPISATGKIQKNLLRQPHWTSRQRRVG